MLKRSLQRLAAGTAVVALAGVILAQATKPADEPKKTVTKSGLTIIEQAPGGSGAVEANDTVWVQYSGKLTDGTEFDASTKHAETRRDGFTFMVGIGQVIRGWDEGLLGMKVGEKRQLIIPSDLGYGQRGSPPRIPPNATLVFDIELIGLKKAPK
jgi:peptidylprolyl isomerase